MAYRVELRPAAQRDLRRVPEKDLERLEPAILSLGDEPRQHASAKLKAAEQVYRLRVGQYRVIYEILEPEGLVVVTRVRRRGEGTYRRL